MNKQKLLLIGQIALPAFCLIAGSFAMLRQVRRGNEAREERGRIDRQIILVDAKLKELEKPRPFIRYPAAMAGPQEQPEFLNIMRGYSAAANVKITKWLSQTPVAAAKAPTATAGSGGSPLSAQPATQNPTAALAAALPPGVTAIPAAVQVNGPFNNVRQFLYSVLSDRRLINLSDVRWSRTEKWPTTGVEFTLTRYVTDKAPAMLNAQLAALNPAPAQQPQQQPVANQTQPTLPAMNSSAAPIQVRSSAQAAAQITTAARTGN